MGNDNTVSMASHFFATRRLESHIAARDARIAELEAALKELRDAYTYKDPDGERRFQAMCKAEEVLNG